MRRNLTFLLSLILATLVLASESRSDDVCPPEYPIDYQFEYRIDGTADGSGYSWCLNAEAYSICDSNVAVPAGSSAEQVAAALAASISAQCPNVTASTYHFILIITVPYSFGHPELWPTLCLGRAGEPPLCCIEFGGQECQLDVDIENYNYLCKCGDADHNFIWTISDAVYLISYIFSGGPAPERSCEGDADGNKIVTISDAVYLISFIFNNGPAPAGC